MIEISEKVLAVEKLSRRSVFAKIGRKGRKTALLGGLGADFDPNSAILGRKMGF
jgi:hypothetical protein